MSYKKEIIFLTGNNFDINVTSYNYQESNGYSPEHAALTILSENKKDKFIIEFNKDKYEVLIKDYKSIEHYQAQEDTFIDQKTVKDHKNTITIRNLETNVSENYSDDLLNNAIEVPQGIRKFVEAIKQLAIKNNIEAEYSGHWNEEDDYGKVYSNRGGHTIEDREQDDFERQSNPINDYCESNAYQFKFNPISDDEIKEFDQYVELKNELSKNKKITAFKNEKQLSEEMKNLTGEGDFTSDKYCKIEKQLFAFIEVERIEKELNDFIKEINYRSDDIISLGLLENQFEDYLDGVGNGSFKEFTEFLEGVDKHAQTSNEEIEEMEFVVEKLKKEIIELTNKIEKEEILRNEIIDLEEELSQLEIILSEEENIEEDVNTLKSSIKEGSLSLKEKKNQIKMEYSEDQEVDMLELNNHLSNAEKILKNYKNEKLDTNINEKLNEKAILDSKIDRFNYHNNALESKILPIIFFENKSIFGELNELTLKDIGSVLVNSDDPDKLLMKLSLLSTDSQIETIYSLSKNRSLVEGFLTNKIKSDLSEEISKPFSPNKNKR
jgi:hypothetical protein